jgi:hypothetical protein
MVFITTLIGKRKRRGKNREIRCMKKDLRKKYIGTRLPNHIHQESHIANHHRKLIKRFVDQ